MGNVDRISGSNGWEYAPHKRAISQPKHCIRQQDSANQWEGLHGWKDEGDESQRHSGERRGASRDSQERNDGWQDRSEGWQNRSGGWSDGIGGKWWDDAEPWAINANYWSTGESTWWHFPWR